MPPTHSLLNLISGAVDYAGLFPPAGLPLREVVANYAAYLKSAERMMLGRLIVPAMKLTEFERESVGLFPTDESEHPWRISALVPSIETQTNESQTSAFEAAIAAIESFNEKNRTSSAVRAVVDAMEVNTPTMAILHQTLERLPQGINAFLEIPHRSDPDEKIRCLANAKSDHRVFAKIRTGGVTPEQIPSTTEVARFITTCARHGVGFKATAGLHHPLRGEYRLTYDKDSPSATMYGFLNVFFAAVIAFEHELADAQVEEILSITSPHRFVFEDGMLAWGDWQVAADRVAEIRDHQVISFGSCSFVEPTRELQLLPDDSCQSVFDNR
jgi:hypothetical protein